MSYDLSVYAASSEPLDRAVLKAELESRGWKIVFIHDEAWSADSEPNFLPPEGPLEGNLVVTGWDPNADLAEELFNAHWNNDFPEYYRLALTGHQAACYLSSSSYSLADDYDEEEVAELEANSATDYVAGLRNATRHYYLRTSGGRSPLSITLQRDTWRALAKLTGGMADDPQEGRHYQGEPPAESNGKLRGLFQGIRRRLTG